jgi:hypothetical protein
MSPEQILDKNKVKIAGSMQNRILSAMEEYGNQKRKEIINLTVDKAIKAIDSLGYTRYDNFDYIQITEALERLKK